MNRVSFFKAIGGAMAAMVGFKPKAIPKIQKELTVAYLQDFNRKLKRQGWVVPAMEDYIKIVGRNE